LVTNNIINYIQIYEDMIYYCQQKNLAHLHMHEKSYVKDVIYNCSLNDHLEKAIYT